MTEYLSHLLNKIPLIHFNILLLLGIVLFGALAGGRLFQKLRVPQVVGYIIIGVLLGESGFRIINSNIMASFRPFNYFALGLIGFMVGGELRKESFQRYGKNFLYILCCEGITPFILVSLFGGIIGSLLFGARPFVWGLALLLGSIASATDPATTRCPVGAGPHKATAVARPSHPYRPEFGCADALFRCLLGRPQREYRSEHYAVCPAARW